MKWTTLCLIVLFSVFTIQGLDDPYKVLGVSRSATISEIRKAYKQLAKEWHPDKNSDPEAESKFVAVNQAYELLSDPERRKQFDMFGRVDDMPRPSKQPNFDAFDDLFTSSGFRFHFADRDITLFHKLSITTRAYENMLVPKSYRTPYLLLFYSDWCFACLQVEPVWRRIMEEVEPIGVGIATVHAENEKSLTRKVGAHSLPSLALLIDGSTYLYKESLFSVQKVVEFVRNKLPKLVTWVNEENSERFLAGWPDNKVRALVFQRSQPIRLRYLLAAFFHRERISFGFVVGNQALRGRYGLRGEQDALLLFNELIERPVASLSMADIPVKTMHDVIYNNYYLILPRLSSQGLLDALCPVGVRRRLCVVLVCQDTAAHDPHRQAMRRFAAESSYSKERVRFMYIFEERQPQFISALSEGGSKTETEGVQVAILARRDSSHIKYEWLSDLSDQREEASSLWLSYNSTKHFLETSIDRLLHTTQALSKEACVGELVDEASQGTVSRLLSKLLLSLEYLQENLAREHVLTGVSVVATLGVILIAAYFMHYLMKLEEAKVEEEAKKKSANGGGANGLQPQLKIHELRAETYNALVRLLKPGCRSIVLLIDSECKTQLLPKFYRVVWPYRRNKTLMFAVLMLDRRGVAWYADVLAQSLPEPRKLTINPRNCVGTVLALNGLRKYFCMYHAKHPEGSLRPHTRMSKMVSKQSGVGSFIGFSDSTSESDLSDVESGNSRQTLVNDKSQGEVLYMERLLDGLPNWLDRLFEGTTHRYHLTYWPDFPTK